MELLIVKALSALVLWVLSLIFGLMLPCLIWRSRAGNRRCSPENDLNSETDCLITTGGCSAGIQDHSGRREPGCLDRVKVLWRRLFRYDIISALNCLCGGLFLGICLLELVPESEQGVRKVLDAAGIHTFFPVAQVMMGAGLLMVMFVEHAVTSSFTMRSTPNTERRHSVISDDVTANEAAPRSSRRRSSSSSDSLRELSSHSSSEAQAASESARSLVLIGMLSIHSIFEGLALGLEVSVAALIELLVAVTVHKCVLAFGLGLRLFETLSRVTIAAACAFLFCSASPLGCVIGVIVSNQTEQSHNTSAITATPPTERYFGSTLAQVSGTLIASAVLECLATGTFLYVTFVEVIPSEFSHNAGDGHDHAEELLASRPGQRSSARKHPRRQKIPIRKSLKLFLLLLGFGAIIGLQFI